MEAAKDLLKRAVDLDREEKYSESLICYEEGIQNLLRAMDGRSESEVKEIRKKAEGYLTRAEEIKIKIKTEKSTGSSSKQQVQYLHIPEGAIGYSYYNVFKSCLQKGGVVWVELEDPYIRVNHQIHNFVRFCEMLVKHCSETLKSITLLTKTGESTEQSDHLSALRDNLLSSHNITLTISYSQTLHDREIRFSNGWMIRLGRGLDYFHKPKGQFSICSMTTTFDLVTKLQSKFIMFYVQRNSVIRLNNDTTAVLAALSIAKCWMN